MSQQPLTGLAVCFASFEGWYCVRKSIQFGVSLLLLLVSIGVLITILIRIGFRSNNFTILIFGSLIFSLIINIIYCFYNSVFWLYSLETLFFNLYYLAIVAFICQAYLLKRRRSSEKLIASQQNRKKQKIIFFAVFAAIITVYIAIFISSIVIGQNDKNNPSYKQKSCQQVWYLCFDILCILMSIIVLIILFKNESQEKEKVQSYKITYLVKAEESIVSKADSSGSDKSLKGERIQDKINNPLKYLWIWIIPNVCCQIINLIQSGLFLSASPSDYCRIIESSQQSNELLQLVFVFLTMYVGYVFTVWYFAFMKLAKLGAIDRSFSYSQEIKINPNIELFVPSKDDYHLFE